MTVHYMADDLLDLCGEADPGPLTVTPVVGDVTCEKCLTQMTAEGDNNLTVKYWGTP